jgi:alkylhydroperoxidase/carboxymuconolactone decarboxylase family protein YurZ
MNDYRPQVYQRFSAAYPQVMNAYGVLAEELQKAGPLTERERHLAKLAIAIGGQSDGAVRSHARRAIAAGIEPDAVRHVAVLAISTAGYPTAMAAYGWIDQVLDAAG